MVKPHRYSPYFQEQSVFYLTELPLPDPEKILKTLCSNAVVQKLCIVEERSLPFRF